MCLIRALAHLLVLLFHVFIPFFSDPLVAYFTQVFVYKHVGKERGRRIDVCVERLRA